MPNAKAVFSSTRIARGFFLIEKNPAVKHDRIFGDLALKKLSKERFFLPVWLLSEIS